MSTVSNDPYENSAARTGLVNRLVAGRYEVLESLGEGPLLAAYRARDRSLNRIVTLKTVLPACAGNQEVVDDLKAGLSQVLSVTHANVARTYDVGVDEETGVVYLAEEFVRGIDLRERIRRAAPFQLSAATEMAIAVAEGLEVAHARGIAHGDVRPSNILIGPDGQIKLTNFGVAVAQNKIIANDPALLLRVVGYTAPDAARSAAPTPSADLYALGVILFEMLTGEMPYPGDNAIQVALKHAQEPIPSPHQINTGIPPSLDGIVRKALGKTPEVRYPSAERMLRDLRTVRDALRYGKSLSWSPLEVEERAPMPLAPPPAAAVPPPNVGATADETLVMPLGRRGATAVVETATVAPRGAGVSQEEEVAMPPARSGGSRWLTSLNLFLFLLILVLIVGGAWWFNTDFLKPTSDVVVPNLVGKTITDAKTLATEQKFDLAIVDKQYRDTEAEGVIYQQGDQPGRTIKEGKSIPIWVSKGPRMAEVPDVTDMTIERARRVLEHQGLRLGDYRGEYDYHEKGVVIDQKPPAREARPRGSRIDVVFSKGEEPTPTPEPIPTPDATVVPPAMGVEATPEPAATPLPESSRTRYFDITYPVPADAEQHRVRIDVLDDNGARTVYDEVRNAGTKVKFRVEAVGQLVTIKVYDNDELRSELTKPQKL
jgi:hypothetical protein